MGFYGASVQVQGLFKGLKRWDEGRWDIGNKPNIVE